ncbi:MAG: outer membrane receptor protein involved in Fe transport [Crocinitomicaceae bacterium]|jgi:outer membrane receptor protein involved in Fe transport
MKLAVFIFLLLPIFCSSQVSGTVYDKSDGVQIYGVKVVSSEDEKIITEPDGKFQLKVTNYPVWIYFGADDYISDSILLESKTIGLMIWLEPVFQDVSTIVVSASKRKQEIEEVPISMEVLKPEFIENKGFVNLEQAVDQTPGVYAMDGQVSIRGGGGYAYGVGSRVLVLTDGIPLVSPDIGDAKWNSISLESLSQIEITKGASSVLYGSSALNGTISLISKEPSLNGDLKVKFQTGIYDNPKRESLKWWSKNPMMYELSVYYGQMKDQWGYTVSADGFTDSGYKDGEDEDRARVSGSFFFRPKKVERLKFDLKYSGQVEAVNKFIVWESDSLGYTPAGGNDNDPNNNSLTFQKSVRLNIDPSIRYFTKDGSKHELKMRYYLVTIGGSSSYFEASDARMFYADYSYQKKWGISHNLIAGATGSVNSVKGWVFGTHTSDNIAAYSQYDFKYKRFNFSAGMRLEYFQMDTLRPDSQFELWNTKSEIPVYPIFRTAMHYGLTKTTHLRASFGQGIRFPSVSERFANTENGGIYIFPNPSLTPERGWAAEVGVKQVFKSGNWKGVLDVAGFVNHYYDMIEFAFGFYLPDSIPASLNPASPGYVNKWIGFKAKNTEEAQITGLEFSFNSEGKIKVLELQSLIGYTYMNPISLNTDPAYTQTFSDSGSTLLKYRFNHLVRVDVQASYKNISLGFSSRYNSFMHNIDNVFEDPISGTEILPGLKDYRAENQQGSLVFDSRLIYTIKEHYTIAFIVNNILNTEYSSRPGDIQPPRQYMMQLRFSI